MFSCSKLLFLDICCFCHTVFFIIFENHKLIYLFVCLFVYLFLTGIIQNLYRSPLSPMVAAKTRSSKAIACAHADV